MHFYFNSWGKRRIAKLEKIGKPLRLVAYQSLYFISGLVIYYLTKFH